MKYIATLIVLASAFALGIVSNAQAQECSNATLHGSFGYTGRGTLLPTFVPPPDAGPFTEVGRQTFDGNGRTHGTATLSSNGDIARVTIEGTYVVNPDCTGTMTLDVIEFGISVPLDFVIDDDGAELRAIETLPGVIVSRVYRRQFREDDED